MAPGELTNRPSGQLAAAEVRAGRLQSLGPELDDLLAKIEEFGPRARDPYVQIAAAAVVEVGKRRRAALAAKYRPPSEEGE